MIYLALFLAAALGLIGALWILKAMDARADQAEWMRLAALQPPDPEPFTPGLVADLPEPARRYFTHAIGRGTPLLPVAEIEMAGKFSLGTQADPGYRPMVARQILCAPHGFVWAMRTTAGMRISGTDTDMWTRFRILGLVPVARIGGTEDHRRAAFGRYVAESVFWTPAAVLPGPGISWEAVDDNTARVTVERGGLRQSVDVVVNAEGQPVTVTFQRWSDANADKTYRLQPFGGRLSDFRDVDGYRLPFHVEAGNMFGTDEYFPFFIAEVTEIRFPRQPGRECGSATRRVRRRKKAGKTVL